MVQLPRVVYVSLWFPKPSETFIFREVVCLRRLGTPMRVCSLYGSIRRNLSAEMAAFAPEVDRLGVSGIGRLLASIAWWWRRDAARTQRIFAAMPIARWGNLERTGENLWAYLAGFALARRFLTWNIEHIHAPWACGPASAALVAGSLTGIPVSFTARAGDIYPPEADLTRKVSQAAFVRVNTSNNVVYLRGMALESGSDPDKIKLIYNALTLDHRGEAPLCMQPPYRLLAIGRFVRTKGFDVLLDACKLLDDWNFDFRLTLVGDGPWYGRLTAQARDLGLVDRVNFPGFVSHEVITSLFMGCDCLLVPSVIDATGDRDGIPNVIMEAMANRVLVIATDVAGIKEVVHHLETGLLLPQRDPQALAEAIQAFTTDRPLALAMAARGRDFVLANFDQKINCDRLLSLFREYARPTVQAIINTR
ncbi:colanic acid/amylovoran biosynthesis glycosyltransferase [Desulfovibrionales bacterium]